MNVPPTDNSKQRKADHIEMALQQLQMQVQSDSRFYYEPLLGKHADPKDYIGIQFLNYQLQAPIWISSMTGGTTKAGIINRNLARCCQEMGFAFALGSCRVLLKSTERLEEFDVRHLLGTEVPLFANLGIAQIDQLLQSKAVDRIDWLCALLKADGLIVHINPLQEWMQPEGDHIARPPLEILEELFQYVRVPIIVKEVGQGFGPQSLQHLLKMPLAALELAGFGGTNFSSIELQRGNSIRHKAFQGITQIGHTPLEMIQWLNSFQEFLPYPIIISGGIQSFLDGYYYLRKLHGPALYGQAGAFLQYAQGQYEDLQQWARLQVEGLQMAMQFLVVK